MKVLREFVAGYPAMYEELYPHVRHLRGFTKLRNISWKLGIEAITSKTDEGYRVETLEGKPVFTSKEDIKYYFYEHEHFAQLYNELLNADVFCDVGGYHGFYSLISEASTNYCFEADSNNAQKIRENILLNPSKDVELIEKAVWCRDGSVNVVEGLEGESHVGSKGKEIEAVTLDSFFENKRDPDVIKLDIEGAEGQVLEGVEKVLERSHPTLFIEFHFDNRLEIFGHTYSELLSKLEDFNYSISVIENRDSEKLVVAK